MVDRVVNSCLFMIHTVGHVLYIYLRKWFGKISILKAHCGVGSYFDSWAYSVSCPLAIPMSVENLA